MKNVKKQLASLACGLALLAAAPLATAFDGNRTGFLLGVGVGAHTSDLEASSGGPSIEGDSSGLALALRIGGGINENVAVYFTRDFQFDGSDETFGLTGGGATYYFRSSGPTAYLTGAIGVGDVSDDDIDTDSAIGFAAMGGAGFAFAGGFQVDGSVMYVDATLDDDADLGADIDFETVSFRVMASYTWF